MKTLQISILSTAAAAVMLFSSCEKTPYSAGGNVKNVVAVSLPASVPNEINELQTASIDLGVDEFITDSDIKQRTAELESLIPINIKVRLTNLQRYSNFQFLEDLELAMVHPDFDHEITIGHLDAGSRNGWNVTLNNTLIDLTEFFTGDDSYNLVLKTQVGEALPEAVDLEVAVTYAINVMEE